MHCDNIYSERRLIIGNTVVVISCFKIKLQFTLFPVIIGRFIHNFDEKCNKYIQRHKTSSRQNAHINKKINCLDTLKIGWECHASLSQCHATKGSHTNKMSISLIACLQNEQEELQFSFKT